MNNSEAVARALCDVSDIIQDLATKRLNQIKETDDKEFQSRLTSEMTGLMIAKSAIGVYKNCYIKNKSKGG